MKTIGLIGGMSWESTQDYYKIINTTIREELGGLHSAKILLYSVDFYEIEQCQASGDWEKSGRILGEAAASLERAGADFILLCTNTMHKVAGAIQSAIGIPFVHLADLTAKAVQEAGYSGVGLLGTRYTMEQDFYKERLVAAGLKVYIPPEEDRVIVNRIIFDELCMGIEKPESAKTYRRISEDLVKAGAQAIILGCTEIGMLIGPEDLSVPVFDTSVIHARRGAQMALEDE